MATARLGAAFAGKPAPTPSTAHRWIVENAKPCRSRLAGEGVFMATAGLGAAFAGKPAPTGITGVQMNCGKRQPPCRSRLAGEGVGMAAARLDAAFAGKPAPTPSTAHRWIVKTATAKTSPGNINTRIRFTKPLHVLFTGIFTNQSRPQALFDNDDCLISTSALVLDQLRSITIAHTVDPPDTRPAP